MMERPSRRNNLFDHRVNDVDEIDDVSVCVCVCLYLSVCVSVVTEVDLSAVSVTASSRLNNAAALHRRDIKPRRRRPLTQYQPHTQTDVDALFTVIISNLSLNSWFCISAAVDDGKFRYA